MARRLVHIFKFLLNKTLVFVQFVSHLSAAVQRIEVNTLAGLVEFTAALSLVFTFSHSFILHSFRTLGDFQFNFFLFGFLFNSSCSRFSSSRSSCTAILRLKYNQTQKKLNDAVLQTNVMQHSDLMTHFTFWPPLSAFLSSCSP